jgi:hypothetical protein
MEYVFSTTGRVPSQSAEEGDVRMDGMDYFFAISFLVRSGGFDFFKKNVVLYR